jgi:pimeloyl-ACP methyl ester carboxylesterase/uncharacterized membrane protein
VKGETEIKSHSGTAFGRLQMFQSKKNQGAKMILTVLEILDVLGLSVLLGGGIYESAVISPNYRSNLPESLTHLRAFFTKRTPANLFRIASPITMIFLLATVIMCWGSHSARWWYLAAFAALILADSITYGFHYPRNNVLFIKPLTGDTKILQRLADEWARGNYVRIVLMVVSIIAVTLAPGTTSALALDSPEKTGYVSVNGLNMYYEIYGSGSPLVLIHGGGSTIETSFGRVLPSFAKTHTVIAVELQAHGHTADIDRPLSFAQDADDVAELLTQLHIARADIFGFSNGASTTLEMAIRYPKLVKKIIVASTMYKKDGAYPWFWDMIAHASFAGMPQQLKDAYLRVRPDTSALFTMFKRDLARMQAFTDISEKEMRSIQAPSFIIIGDQDIVRPEHAVEMSRVLPHAQLAILPGVHGEYIGEITTPQDSNFIQATVSIIEKFLHEPMPDASRSSS